MTPGALDSPDAGRPPAAPPSRGPAPETGHRGADADRRRAVAAVFDGGARHYDRVGRSLDLGSGAWYRGYALRRAGLRPGMALLDVATGTGLLARAGVRILGDPGEVVGLDASAAMLREARRTLASPLVQGWAEALPFRADRFDMLSMGFALRYVADLERVVAECWRVLRPGGRLLFLELARPEAPVGRWLVRTHLERVLPWIVGLRGEREPARRLTRYCWETIDRGVPPATILEVLGRSGFADVRRHVWFGLVAEYFATKPARSATQAREGRSDARR